MLDDILNTVGDVLSAPRKALWGLAPGLHDADTGDVYSGSQVAHNAFGVDPESFWGKALGFGLETAGDPLPLMSGLAMKGLGLGAKAFGGAAGAAEEAVPSLMNSRRGVGMVKDFGPGLENEALGQSLGLAAAPDYGGRLVGAMPEGIDQGLAGKLLAKGEDYFSSRRGAGVFLKRRSDNVGLGFLPEGTPQSIVRHETTHGLINRAANTGDYAGLGPIANVAARFQRAGVANGGTGIMAGIGDLADEMAGHAAEARGFFPQLGNAAKFLMSPQQGYIDQFTKTSPLVGAMYANSPALAAGLGGAGALGVGYPIARSFQGN